MKEKLIKKKEIALERHHMGKKRNKKTIQNEYKNLKNYGAFE